MNDDRGGFAHVGDRLIHQGWVVGTVEGTYTDPEGGTFTRTVIRHPGAVVVLPVHDDGTITLVRQYRPAVDRLALECPAGTKDDPSASAEEMARRELKEETGLAAERMDYILSIETAPGILDQVTDVFIATGLTSTETDRHGIEEEHMTIVRLSLEEVGAAIRSGELRDAATLISILEAGALKRFGPRDGANAS